MVELTILGNVNLLGQERDGVSVGEEALTVPPLLAEFFRLAMGWPKFLLVASQ